MTVLKNEYRWCANTGKIMRVLYLYHGYSKNQKSQMQITKSGKHNYDSHQAKLLGFLQIYFPISDFYAFAV